MPAKPKDAPREDEFVTEKLAARRTSERGAKSVRVLLDTNFLVDMFRFRQGFDEVEDIVGGSCEFYIVDKTIGELRGMSDKSAKVALQFLKIKSVRVISLPSASAKDSKGAGSRRRHVDDAIVMLASGSPQAASNSQSNDLSLKPNPGKFFVATNDTGLRKRLKPLGVRTIYLRARKQLEIH